MSMTIAVTRNVPGRFRGFFASSMLEVAPGVYVAPRMKKSVRQRVWKTVMEWSELLPPDAGIAFMWKSRSAPSGLGLNILGWPKKELLDHEGTWLATRTLTANHDQSELNRLTTPVDPGPSEDTDPTFAPHLPDLGRSDESLINE